MTKVKYLKLFWHSIFHHNRNHKYINGTQGVISIFLAILMVPFATIAGSLVNAARIDSAAAIFDEALCNASNSTLGTYDSFLRKRFSLLAMAQAQDEWGGAASQAAVNKIISETFEFYLEQNTKALSNTYLSYDAEAMGEFPLASPSVLEYQIMEFGKFAVPAKLVEDSLSIDELIKKLEKMIPGYNWFGMLSSAGGAINKGMSLGEHLDDLQDAVTNEEVSVNDYNNKHQAFYDSIQDYFDLINERDSKISEINNMSDEQIDKRVEEIDKRLEELEEEKQTGGETEAIRKETEKLNEEKTKILGWKNDRTGSIQKITEEYEEKLKTQKSSVGTKKSEYSSSIKTLRNKLSATMAAYEKVISDTTGLIQSVVNTGVETGSAIGNLDGKKEKNAEKALQDQIKKTDDEGTKKDLQDQLDTLKGRNKNAATGRSNADSIAKATGQGLSEIGTDINDQLKQFDTALYDELSGKLETLKNEVDAYDTENIVSITWEQLYLTISGLMDSSKLQELEDNLVKEITGGVCWGLLDTLIGFVGALFKATVLFVPELNAEIDEQYYNTTYGGLPSSKDRNAHPLAMGEDSDREASQRYRTMFGGADLSGGANDLSIDLLELIENIIEDFSYIHSQVTKIMTLGIVGLVFLMTELQNLANKAEHLVGQFKLLVENFQISTLAKNVGQKTLVAGYGFYMTSNRLTYNGGTTLFGTSFNLRGQTSTAPSNSLIVNGFSSLLNIANSGSGDASLQKCFVGAESEYLLVGDKSEYANQAYTFLIMYLLRLLPDMIPIFGNTELQAIASGISAATFGIGGPIFYIAAVLIEPLIDTILIVNGGEVDLVKGTPYLAPSNLPKLISDWSGLKMTTDQVNSYTTKLQEKYNNTDFVDYTIYAGTGEVESGGIGFKVDYSKLLFICLLLGVKKSTMLARLANVIEMESVENLSNTRGKSGIYDLDYAYTYIRSRANFTTNEFLPLSNTGGFRIRESIIYKGY